MILMILFFSFVHVLNDSKDKLIVLSWFFKAFTSNHFFLLSGHLGG